MRFMIIDDIMMNILVLKQAVRPFGDVDGFQNWEEGLTALREAYQSGNPYDMLFLDILMPGRNGLEILKEVQTIGGEHPSLQRTKVVMLTSDRERESFQEAMRHGAASYVLRPFQPERVQSEIRRLTEGTGRGTQQAA